MEKLSQQIQQSRILLFGGVLIIFVILILLIPRVTVVRNEIADTRMTAVSEPPLNSVVRIIGERGIVKDLKTGELLYTKNYDEPGALASLTKIMTATVALDSLSKDTTAVISEPALLLEGDAGLLADEVWTAEDLLAFTLVASSNDGARAISQTAWETLPKEFVSQMNAKAKELGLTTMFFLNETGLDVTSTISGGYGSPSDVATLLEYALRHHYDVFKHTQRQEILVASNTMEHAVENTNGNVLEIPSLLISKTGLTDIAGGNLGIIFEIEPMHPIAVVVMGSTTEGRLSDVHALVDAVIQLSSPARTPTALFTQ